MTKEKKFELKNMNIFLGFYTRIFKPYLFKMKSYRHINLDLLPCIKIQNVELDNYFNLEFSFLTVKIYLEIERY